MISLGCTKNLVDSEVMLGLLREKGYGITPNEEDADILIVNTCAFIDAAKRESMDTILELVRSNRSRGFETSAYRKIIVAGCLVQRYGDQLEEELRGDIHALVGVGDFHYITDACEAALAGEGFFNRVSKLPVYLYDHRSPRLRAMPSHFAYVKIAEGCDNCCSYCVIPQVRGRYRSRPIESIVAEVRSLAQAGVKEINLIAQDTTYYGHDLREGEAPVGPRADLPSLLRRLIRIPDIQWVRILYGHPAHISDELLALIAQEEKICSYIDVPVQHIHDHILRKMGRRTTQSQIRALIAKIRNTIPEVTLRTSLIVGFPGETEQHFNTLMQFVEQIQFDHLGVFAYSAEEGTKAADIRDRVPESVKKQRMDRMAQLHQRIAMKKRQRLIGRQKVVLVDNVESQVVGRIQEQAPEIDDVVYITDADARNVRALPLSPGEFVKLQIIDTRGPYDLIGRLVP
jgi:ribosomal protein S12 methylthiotransferase